MKVNIRINTDVDEQEEIINLVKYLFNNSNHKDQKKLPSDNKESNNKDRKYFCNNSDCKKEITKDVVAFCLHLNNKDRFKGKVFCRECQEGK